MGNAYRDREAFRIGMAETRRILNAKIPEASFQEQVIDLAALTGWKFFHPHDSRRSVAGWPDLVLLRGPRMIAAELKSQSGRVTAEQQGWLDALALVPGVETYLWRPSDWDEIRETLGGRVHASL